MAEKRVERRLAAILCADVAGYSRLMGSDEEGTLAALKAHRSALIDPTVAAHQGRIVSTAGDGMLIEFNSVVDAVRAAVAMQQGLALRNADVAEERRILFRIGINLGDIIVDDGDIFGDGVNVAARLEQLAEPGTICISSAVREQVGGKLELAFADLGEHQVKNIERPIHVYRVEAAAPAASGSEPGPGPGFAAAAHHDRPSIAVLPFTNMSGDAEQEYFADGMVEDIITGLSRIKWLAVIARNSSFTYKGKAADIKQVARDLGVRYVLEGSVRRAGNRVRITGQLIEAESGTHIWAERFDRALDDVFALQDEITLSVVGAIEPNLRQAELERVRRKRPDNLDAHDLVLRALPFAFTSMPEDASKAIPLLERAVELEPRYAGAHALLAWCHEQRYMRGGMLAEERDAALAHARTALTHGADDATALAVGGFVIAILDGDNVTAFDAFDRALALSPSSVLALSCSAITLAWAHRTDLAIERAERALRLSPFDPLSYVPHLAIAISHLLTERFAEAAEAARRAVQANPRFSLAHAVLAATLVCVGRRDEAKAAARQVLELEPSFTIRELALQGPAGEVSAKIHDALREAGLPE